MQFLQAPLHLGTTIVFIMKHKFYHNSLIGEVWNQKHETLTKQIFKINKTGQRDIINKLSCLYWGLQELPYIQKTF